MPPSLAVVTGASSGLGLATARALASRGLTVLAGVRSEEAGARIAGPGVEPVVVDICDEAQVAALAERVGGRLDVLVNNAGVAINAPVETMPLAEWRRQFDVNFFGHVAVTQALMPALVAARGRVVNISSLGGKVATPTFGAYAGSKFALEAMSDALRREVARMGVSVVVVEPGSIATPIWEKGTATADDLAAGMTPDQQTRYSALVDALRRQAKQMERRGIAPEAAAAVVAEAATTPKPRTRYLVGRDAKVGARVAKVVPDRVLDRLIARDLGI